MEKKRDKWSSGLGFVLAAAGSAIGLGNIWKFPYLVGKNGGGAFVVVYLIIIFTVGLSLILGEIVIGRAMQKNVYGSYKKVSNNFKFAGILAVITGFSVACFYCVIGGWVVRYFVAYLLGGVNGNSSEFYNNFISSPSQTIICFLVYLVANAIIIQKGISGGIEKASKFMMPVLIIILVLFSVRSFFLPNAMEGIRFFLKPDLSKITPTTVVDALAQTFFSLSLGMGTLITYGSYLGKHENIKKTSIYIPLLDTLIAIMAGFAILPAVFSFGFQPTEGPGLTFVTLPAIFQSMPLGNIFGLLFFVLLLFAAITSSISMLEVVVSFAVEETTLSRTKTVAILVVACSLIGIPCALSTNILEGFKIFGLTVFDLMDKLSSYILMPIGGILTCIFIGYIWGPKKAIFEITNEGKLKFSMAGVWIFFIKYLSPIVLILITITSLLKM